MALAELIESGTVAAANVDRAEDNARYLSRELVGRVRALFEAQRKTARMPLWVDLEDEILGICTGLEASGYVAQWWQDCSPIDAWPVQAADMVGVD